MNFVFLIGSTERAIRINSGSLIVSLPTSIISLWLLISIFTNFLLSAVPLVNSRYNYMADKYCNFNPVAHSSLKSDHHYKRIVPSFAECVRLAYSWLLHITPGAPNENVVQNHLNIALLNVF